MADFYATLQRRNGAVPWADFATALNSYVVAIAFRRGDGLRYGSTCTYARVMMGADGLGEGLSVEFGGREIISPFPGDPVLSLNAGFDHADHGQTGKARLVGVAAAGEQPIDLVANDVAALLELAMVGVGCPVRRIDHSGWRSV
jgi:hypothetical protein